jgi:hypothetical protein
MRDDPSDIALAAPPGWRAAVAEGACLRAARAVRWHDHEGLPAGDQMPLDPTATVTGRRSPHLAAVIGDRAGDDIEVKEPRGEQGD